MTSPSKSATANPSFAVINIPKVASFARHSSVCLTYRQHGTLLMLGAHGCRALLSCPLLTPCIYFLHILVSVSYSIILRKICKSVPRCTSPSSSLNSSRALLMRVSLDSWTMQSDSLYSG